MRRLKVVYELEESRLEGGFCPAACKNSSIHRQPEIPETCQTSALTLRPSSYSHHSNLVGGAVRNWGDAYSRVSGQMSSPGFTRTQKQDMKGLWPRVPGVGKKP